MIDIEKIKRGKSFQDLLEFSILNIDKPSNYTSFETAEIVGRMLNARKFSHFGTLDPAVTGVLPVALNRACKLTGWFMKKKKEYVGIMKIHKQIEEKKLVEEMGKFLGKIIQMPPVKSRVKRQEREREVYSWKLLEFDKDKKEALFSCEVEAGTYIRKLCSDLGEKIGGAHMTELRRTKAGIFSENDKEFVNLYELEKIKDSGKSKDFLTHKNSEEFLDNPEELRKILIPGEIISKILPVAFINDKNLRQILTGKPIFKEELSGKLESKEGDVAIFCNERFIGVYRKEGEV
jgi:H/ACA ribonucleoprotein complex subunit 4